VLLSANSLSFREVVFDEILTGSARFRVGGFNALFYNASKPPMEI